jgi:hypothetical protein
MQAQTELMRTELIEQHRTTERATGSAASGPTRTTHPIPVGMQVELRSRFDDRWTHGFAIAARGEGEYRVRRMSDGCVLPAWFPAGMLRPVLED